MKIKVQIKGSEHLIIKLLKGLNINIYSINHIKDRSIYKIDKNDIKKIPKNLIVYKSKTIKESIIDNKEFIVSTLIGVLFLLVFSNIIFNIKIIHNDKNIRYITKKELDKYGLKLFTFKKNYKEIESIKQKILNDYKNQYEWIEIIPNGMSYIVKIEKRVLTQNKKEKPFCDIVATKNAIIRKIQSFKGQTILDIGDYVHKGDTIISGEIRVNEDIKSTVCAEGVVRGNVWYSSNIKYPLYEYKKIYSGKDSSNIEIKLGSKSYTIFNVHFKHFITNKKRIIKIGNFEIIKHTNKEYHLKKIKLTKKSAINKALNLSKNRLLQRLKPNSQIINQKVLQSNKYNSIINMTVFYSVDEVVSKQIEKNKIENKEEEEG